MARRLIAALLITFAGALCAVPSDAAGTAGSLDLTFGHGGRVVSGITVVGVGDSAVQSDGKIVVAASVSNAPGANDGSDGAFVKMKYSQITDNGRTYDQKDLDSHTVDSNAGWMAGKAFFREPFEPGHLDDYSYDGSGDAGLCAASAAVVHFTSKLRDQQHGDGTMCVDKASKHVLLIKFVPAVLPQYASTGAITEALGEALPGTWHVLKIEEHYSGHVVFIHGTSDITADYRDFRRFTTLDAGLASLTGNS